MAIPHVDPGEVVDVRPLGPALATTQTTTLVKTQTLQVIRLILHTGKEVCHQHSVEGEVVVQCLEGRINVQVEGGTSTLEAGQMLYLAGGQSHTIVGASDASALLTILLR